MSESVTKLSSYLKSSSKYVSGFAFESFVAFLIFLAILIVTGRILNKINDAGIKDNADINEAKKWAGASVGISAAGLALTLIVLIIAIVVYFKKPKIL